MLRALQDVLLAYLRRDAGRTVPFWRMATLPVSELGPRSGRADAAGPSAGRWAWPSSTDGSRCPAPVPCPAPPSRRPGWCWTATGPRSCATPTPPVIARVQDGRTFLDLRTVEPADDDHLAIALAGPGAAAGAVRVVATAGHVDHGKSSLVLALTGTDPDRFEEEKRRGLTIDLGFAHTDAAVRAPASASSTSPATSASSATCWPASGAVDACLFVVAATEGWKPQSEEHLRILELLGIEHGRGRADQGRTLVDDDVRRSWPHLDVADHVAGTFLAGAPVVRRRAPDRRGARRSPGARSTTWSRRTPAARRPRPAPAVGRPGLRRQGQRHGGDRHAHGRRAGRGRPGRGRPGATRRPASGPSRA